MVQGDWWEMPWTLYATLTIMAIEELQSSARTSLKDEDTCRKKESEVPHVEGGRSGSGRPGRAMDSEGGCRRGTGAFWRSPGGCLEPPKRS